MPRTSEGRTEDLRNIAMTVGERGDVRRVSIVPTFRAETEETDASKGGAHFSDPGVVAVTHPAGTGADIRGERGREHMRKTSADSGGVAPGRIGAGERRCEFNLRN
jgi:hypothetical protein